VARPIDPSLFLARPGARAAFLRGAEEALDRLAPHDGVDCEKVTAWTVAMWEGQPLPDGLNEEELALAEDTAGRYREAWESLRSGELGLPGDPPGGGQGEAAGVPADTE
jgi:hypothetical protein